MENKKILEILQKGQAAYEKIQGKTLHYVYWKNGKHHELICTPHKKNFMHLTGYNYMDPRTKRKINGGEFYKILKKGKLSFEGLIADKFTEEKMNVLAYLDQVLTCKIRIIDEHTRFLKLDFDSGIRTSQAFFCLCLTYDNTKNPDFVPKSLINLKTSNLAMKNGHPVHCIYSVDHKTKKITQLAKKKEFYQSELKKPYSYPYTYEVAELDLKKIEQK
ncbi:hypothetical protein I0292_26815 (plasmid) [Priestia megaterium]|uniref:PBECR4 domain-containing protein n=1 Tax=Priestia megaterium TaxID=1404 RepID=UPI00205C33FF|nr:PBECR4 domain-containing protein [Priestia megaterium]UOO43971.1 hypothetical protein I0292_26815 [Priestia megaterium]